MLYNIKINVKIAFFEKKDLYIRINKTTNIMKTLKKNGEIIEMDGKHIDVRDITHFNLKIEATKKGMKIYEFVDFLINEYIKNENK